MADQKESLVQKLDEELASFVNDKIEKGKPTGYEYVLNQTPEELANDLKKHPAFMTDVDLSQPLSEATEGMIAMKYESDNPTENAENYKEEGNLHFKNKKYHWAIKNFRAGIALKCDDKLLNAQLHGNCAASHVRLCNWRSALNECISSRKFSPDYLKAITRGAECCKMLKRYADCLNWTDCALMIAPDNKSLLEQRKLISEKLSEQERNLRKKQFNVKKVKNVEELLLNAIKNRNIRVDKNPATSTAEHPNGGKVQLEDGVLSWPVLFLYPQYQESDYLVKFDERQTFEDHLENMFSEKSPCISWDKKREYIAKNIIIYFEDRSMQTLYRLSPTISLNEALQHKRYLVREGTPSFILMVDNEFQSHYIKNYTVKKF